MRFTIENGVLTKFEKETSKLRIGGGSWTIKKEWIDNPQVNSISYKTQEREYFIPKEIACSKGWYLKLGDEDKLVVPIKNWKVREYANNHTN